MTGTKATVPRGTKRAGKARRKAGERRGRRTVGGKAKPARRPREAVPAVRDVPVSPDSLVAFVRAGGTVPLLTWIDLPTEIQAALERAGTQVRAEFALAVAAAVRSPEGAEVVAEAADPLATDEVWARRALDKASAMLGRTPPKAVGA